MGGGLHRTAICVRCSHLCIIESKDARPRPLARIDDGALGHPYGDRRHDLALDFEGNYGLINQVLGTNIVWLGDANTVWGCLLLVSAWKGIPLCHADVPGGITGDPGGFVRSRLCGRRGPFRRFRYITLPMLSPVIMVTAALTSMVATWTKFETIWVLTSGGPGYTTSILPVYVYMKAFRSFEVGMGSAVAVIAMLVMTIFIVIYLKFYRKNTRKGCENMNKKRKPVANVCFYLCLAVVMIIMLFPVLWLILSTLKPNEEIFSSQLHFFPVNPPPRRLRLRL